MKFYMIPVIYEDAIQSAFEDAHDREVNLYDAFMPEDNDAFIPKDNVIFVGLDNDDIEHDAIEAENFGDESARERNRIREILLQYLPIGTKEAIIMMD